MNSRSFNGKAGSQKSQNGKADKNSKTSLDEPKKVKDEKSASEVSDGLTVQIQTDPADKSKFSDNSNLDENGTGKSIITQTEELNVNKFLEAASPEISTILKEIESVKAERDFVRRAIKEKKLLLKPIKTVDKKLSLKITRLSSEKRKAERVNIKHLEDRELLLNEKLAELNRNLSEISKKESIKLDEKKLYDKASSAAYIKKNEYAIKQRLLDGFNNILQKGDEIQKYSFDRVRRFSLLPDKEENIQNFNEALAELLKNTDRKTFILSSGKLKGKLYEAVRLTLQQLGKEDKHISRLVFPEDLKKERKTAPDIFENSRPLIRHLITRMFNQALPERKEELMKLRDLAKGDKITEEFKREIDLFVYGNDEEVYTIGTGGVKDRLHETLRLTILKWQPDLMGEFEYVEIAPVPEIKLEKKESDPIKEAGHKDSPVKTLEN